MIQLVSVFSIFLVVVSGGCEKKSRSGRRAERESFTDANGPSSIGNQAASPAATALEPSRADAGEAAAGDDQPASQGTVPEIEPAQAAETILLRAVGRARSSADLDLARQAAASRAREKLQKLLARHGLQTDTEKVLPETTIEKYYKKGKYVYAVARCEVPGQKPVNVSGGAASKAPVNETGRGEGKSPPGPQGGKR
ncbi:MAG: hypothetical protein D6806_10365 [Deltaproteobacteria bacterium]|nr:MAG: hypothetical protein D6806_10365 [Deltaproteobacteria bacterium]